MKRLLGIVVVMFLLVVVLYVVIRIKIGKPVKQTTDSVTVTESAVKEEDVSKLYLDRKDLEIYTLYDEIPFDTIEIDTVNHNIAELCEMSALLEDSNIRVNIKGYKYDSVVTIDGVKLHKLVCSNADESRNFEIYIDISDEDIISIPTEINTTTKYIHFIKISDDDSTINIRPVFSQVIGDIGDDIDDSEVYKSDFVIDLDKYTKFKDISEGITFNEVDGNKKAIVIDGVINTATQLCNVSGLLTDDVEIQVSGWQYIMTDTTLVKGKKLARFKSLESLKDIEESDSNELDCEIYVDVTNIDINLNVKPIILFNCTKQDIKFIKLDDNVIDGLEIRPVFNVNKIYAFTDKEYEEIKEKIE